MRNVAKKFTCISFCASSSGNSPHGIFAWIEAFATRMSGSEPSASSLSKNASMALGSESSHTFVLWRTTFAPYSSSASPMAFPIPRVLPVTRAVFPVRSNFSFSMLFS